MDIYVPPRLEPSHPSLRHLGPTWRIRDEVYQFRDLRPDARVLLRVPEEQLDHSARGAKRLGYVRLNVRRRIFDGGQQLFEVRECE